MKSLHCLGGLFFVVTAFSLSVSACGKSAEQLRRAKTTEAIDQLDKIYKGAVSYYQMPKASPIPGQEDHWLPCQFPKSVKTTPAESCCKADADKDGRCDAATHETWDKNSWAALSFEMHDQHYYVYEFVSTGTGANAIFTASAYGDLDCDGVMSTFRRVGFGLGGSAGDCTVKGSSAFIKEKEAE